ncbi:hypothetical protein ACTFJN_17660, partial [Pseudomonas juntendi]
WHRLRRYSRRFDASTCPLPQAPAKSISCGLLCERRRISRVETTHEDPAISAFLGLLEADIRSGPNLTTLQEDMAQTMLANANHSVNLDEDIDGEVAL